MKDKKYDLIIVGGGAAGLVAGVASGSFGAKTLIIDKERLGGECSWTGCIPSKTFISLANLVYKTDRGFWNRDGSHRISGNQDLGRVFDYVREIINLAPKKSKVGKLLEKYGVEVLFGTANFLDNHNIQVDGKIYSSKKFILSTGSSPVISAIKGLNSGFLTNREIWDLKTLPKSLLIIGGGPIGIEMGQAFNRLGTKVTIFHSDSRILPKDDHELSDMLKDRLIKEGVDINLDFTISEVKKINSGWEIPLTGAVNSKTGITEKSSITSEKLLISLGRQANTEGLDLEAASVIYDRKAIHVDKYLRTAAPNIWAAGDCTGRYQFSHIAEAEAKIAVRNALFPLNFKVDYQGIPWTTFTDPEFAHLGLTEEQCIQKKINFKIYSQSFSGDDRAITEGSDFGKVKIISNSTGKILGAHILGPRAGELINEAVLARRKNLAIYDIGLTIHVYPTLGLALQRATDEYFADLVRKPFYNKLINMLRIK